jgi:hypothetical protein
MNKSEWKRFFGLSPRLRLSNRGGLGLGPVDMGRDGSDLWGLSAPARIPRRCSFFLLAQRKRTKRKGTPIAWPFFTKRTTLAPSNF